jgi:hypothetical protein
VLNERVAVFVDAFFDQMARLYQEQGWPWREPERGDGRWDHDDFTIRVARRFNDKAARTLEVKLRNLPGIEAVNGAGNVEVTRDHRFRIDIPRSYPNNLGAIVVRSMKRLYHPRIGTSGRGEACIHVNGEIDRVLLNLIRQILLDPACVQPPKLYRGQDRGMNVPAMNWYEKQPHRIHRRLLDLWAQAHGADAFIEAEKGKVKVEIEGENA